MAANPDSNLRQRVLALIARSVSGITAQELTANLNPAPNDRDLRQCLNDLADEALITSDGAAKPRFIALAGDTAAPTIPPVPAPAVPPTVTPPITRAAPRAAPNGAPASTPMPAATEVPAPTAADPDFEPMFELAAPMIITTRMSRSLATGALRMQALRNEKAGRAMIAYVEYALARLDRLTVADAPSYGATADELIAWYHIYRG